MDVNALSSKRHVSMETRAGLMRENQRTLLCTRICRRVLLIKTDIYSIAVCRNEMRNVVIIEAKLGLLT